MRTVDRAGHGLPILQESGTDRSFAYNNKMVERHVEAKRVKWSKITRQLQGEYRRVQKRITSHLTSLVRDDKLLYLSLKRWIHTLRPRLIKDRALGGNPKVENMLNEFYSPFYDVDSLKELIAYVEKYLGRPIPVKAWLQQFEEEVDHFLSSRVIVPGVNGDGRHDAIFCIDPEWSNYPACDLYKVHERIRKALHRVRGQPFSVVYFCTVLKGYVLLSCIEDFAQKMRERVERQPIGVDGLAGSPLSKKSTSPPSTNESEPKEDQIGLLPDIKEAEGSGLPRTIKEVESTSSLVDSGSEYVCSDDQVVFPSPVKDEAQGHSVLITGLELVHSMIFTSTTMGGWPSLDYYISEDLERVSLVSDNNIIIKPFLYHYLLE